MVTNPSKSAVLLVFLGVLLLLTLHGAFAPDTGWCQEAQEDKDAKVHANFGKAVTLYNQGKLKQARDLFLEVKNSGVYLGFFKNRDLHNYLARIEGQLRKRPAERVDAMSAKFDRAETLYRQKRYVEAKRLFQEVRDSKANLGFFKTRALTSYLARIDEDIRNQRREASAPPKQPDKKPAAAEPLTPRAKADRAEKKPRAVEKPKRPPTAAEVARVKREQMIERYDKGVWLYDQGRWSEARDVFQKVADSGIDLGWWRNRSLQSKLLSAKQRAERAAVKAVRAPEPAPDRKKELMRKFAEAEALFAAGEFGDAALLYQEIVGSNVDLGAEVKRKVSQHLEAALTESRNIRTAAVGEDQAAKRLLGKMRAERRIRQEKNTALADHYAAVGEKFYNQRAYTKAREQLQKALKLVPDHPRATHLLQKTEAVLGVEGERFKTQADRLSEEKAVQLQQKKFEMENKLRDGVAMLKADRYDDALAAFEMTAIIINRLRRDMDVSAYEDHLNSLVELATRRREERQTELKALRKREAEKQAQEDEERQDEVREQKIQKMYEQAYSAFLKEKYEEVIRTCRDLLYEDAKNPAAEALLERAKIEKEKKAWEDIRKDDIEGTEADRRFYEKRMVPDLDVEGFPERAVWEKVSQREPVSIPAPVSELSEYERQLDRMLDEKRVDISFESTPILDVVNFLRTLVEMNIILHSEVPEDTTITLDLKDVSLRAALDNICMLGEDLDYAIREEAIWIMPKEAAAMDMVTLVYDVRDLLLAVIDRPRRPQVLGETAGEGGESGGDFGGGGQTSNIARDSQGRDLMDVELQVRGQQLVKSLVHITGPEKWAAAPAYIMPHLPKGDDDDLGEAIEGEGEAGTIAFRDGDLVIRQTESVHNEIKDVLSQLRSSLYLQVQIDCRILHATDDFLEEVGTDITDLLFRSDGQQLLNPQTGPTTPPFNTSPTFPVPTGQYANRWQVPSQYDPYLNGTTAYSNLFSVSNPFDALGNAAQSLSDTSFANVLGTRGLNLGLAILGDVEATLVIRAAQDSNKADIVSCPRLTVFNTQRANVSIGTSYAYVSDVDVGNQGALDPEINSITTRTSLDVRPVISADRRFVCMELFPEELVLPPPPGGLDQDGNELRFRQLPIEAWVSYGNIPLAQTAYVDLPEQHFLQIETTVVVPDRGHLLLGGMSVTNKREVESGVPVLNKIPILKRLFSRHGTVKRRGQNIFIIHPTILAQDELENNVY